MVKGTPDDPSMYMDPPIDNCCFSWLVAPVPSPRVSRRVAPYYYYNNNHHHHHYNNNNNSFGQTPMGVGQKRVALHNSSNSSNSSVMSPTPVTRMLPSISTFRVPCSPRSAVSPTRQRRATRVRTQLRR